MSAISKNTCWPPCITPQPPSATTTPPWRAMTIRRTGRRCPSVIRGSKAEAPLTRQRGPSRKPAKSENSVFPCGQDGPKRSILVTRHRRASSMGALKQGPLREKSASFWMCLMVREQTMGRSALRASAFDAEAYKTFKQLTGARKWRLEWAFFLGENGRRQYNKLCKGCDHPFKQSFRVVLISCPHYQSHARKSVGIGVENRAKNCP